MGAYGIPGDPAGMRALAATLRVHAAGIASLESWLAGELAGMVFEGPAAERFWAEAESGARRRVQYAVRLLDVANLLESSAAEVEAAQREAARRIEEQRQAELAERRAMLR